MRHLHVRILMDQVRQVDSSPSSKRKGNKALSVTWRLEDKKGLSLIVLTQTKLALCLYTCKRCLSVCAQKKLQISTNDATQRSGPSLYPLQEPSKDQVI